MTSDNVPLRLMRLPEVKTVTGLSRSTIYKMVSEAAFPRPVKINERAVGWREHEVQAWVAERPYA